MTTTREAASRPATDRPKRNRTPEFIVYVVVVLLLLLGGGCLWRQIQFTELREPLLKAVAAGDTAAVRTFLEQGADPNVPVDYQPVPFRLADLWNRLLGQGANERLMGKTVLMSAAEKDQGEIVRLLLDHGADSHRSIRIEFPMTALDFAACSGARKSLKALLDAGADLNPKGDVEITPLCEAVIGEPLENDTADPLAREKVALLLQLGADVNGRTYDGETALVFAVRQPSYPTVRFLLAHGADVNAHDWNGVTALMIAVRRGYRDSAKALLDAGAALDAQDEDGKTALQYAVENFAEQADGPMRGRSLAMVSTLLDRGASTQARDTSGKTILQIAESLPNKKVIALLRRSVLHVPGAGKAVRR